jgi:hypothetical protein
MFSLRARSMFFNKQILNSIPSLLKSLQKKEWRFPSFKFCERTSEEALSKVVLIKIKGKGDSIMLKDARVNDILKDIRENGLKPYQSVEIKKIFMESSKEKQLRIAFDVCHVIKYTKVPIEDFDYIVLYLKNIFQNCTEENLDIYLPIFLDFLYQRELKIINKDYLQNIIKIVYDKGVLYDIKELLSISRLVNIITPDAKIPPQFIPFIERCVLYQVNSDRFPHTFLFKEGVKIIVRDMFPFCSIQFIEKILHVYANLAKHKFLDKIDIDVLIYHLGQNNHKIKPHRKTYYDKKSYFYKEIKDVLFDIVQNETVSIKFSFLKEILPEACRNPNYYYNNKKFLYELIIGRVLADKNFSLQSKSLFEILNYVNFLPPVIKDKYFHMLYPVIITKMEEIRFPSHIKVVANMAFFCKADEAVWEFLYIKMAHFILNWSFDERAVEQLNSAYVYIKGRYKPKSIFIQNIVEQFLEKTLKMQNKNFIDRKEVEKYENENAGEEEEI